MDDVPKFNRFFGDLGELLGTIDKLETGVVAVVDKGLLEPKLKEGASDFSLDFGAIETGFERLGIEDGLLNPIVEVVTGPNEATRPGLFNASLEETSGLLVENTAGVERIAEDLLNKLFDTTTFEDEESGTLLEA